MNKYIRKLFGVISQGKQIQQVVPVQLQQLPLSPEEWHLHWQSLGQPWRTEPEIDAKRQEELSRCRAIIPDIEKGIYPFKGMKLSRADVEWLLATHENGRGPVDWNNESQRVRQGLDVRGADLRQEDLSDLPLARLQAGLAPIKIEWRGLTEGQRAKAVMLLAEADYIGAHLEEVNLTGAHLEGADLCDAHLEGAYFCVAHLEEAHLAWAHLKLADFAGAHLERTNLTGAHLEEASLDNAILGDKQCIGPRLVDVHWDNTHLAVVDWSQVKELDEEHEARQKKTPRGEMKDQATSVDEYRIAVRANRQLAVAFLNQGLNEDAARFDYRAQILQRKVLWKQRDFGKWLFSTLLALMAGYGYRMWRILAAYLIVVSVCAVAYFIIGTYHPPHLTLLQAFLESITAFHGRVFYELFTPETPQIWVTAFEAVAGLVIEGIFIAMLAQRFFGK